MEPRDFASYLLAIFIVNLLMYFAFYIIMKVKRLDTAPVANCKAPLMGKVMLM